MRPKTCPIRFSREELARKFAAAFLSTKLNIPFDQALQRVPLNVDYYWLETADCVIEASAWLDLNLPRRY